MSRLRRLQHSQLVRLIGVCCHGSEELLYGIVVEYPTYGDLKCYLRQHAVITTAAVDAAGTRSQQTLSNSSLTLVRL